MRDITREWALYSSLCILLMLIIMSYQSITSRTGGILVYGSDDVYIHMAVAKNLVLHGVWGVTRYGFTSSTSSIIWPLMISLVYKVFGVNNITPLVFNVILSILLVFYAYRLSGRYVAGQSLRFMLLLSLILFLPLPLLVFNGLEHVLHILLTLLFAFYSAIALSKNVVSSRECYYLYALAPLMTMTRYESMMTIGIVSLLFLLRRRPMVSLALFSAGVLPIIVYGVVSMGNGWFFLPNSLILKGGLHQDVSSHPTVVGRLIVWFTVGVIRSLMTTQTLVILLAVLFLLKKYQWDGFHWSEVVVLAAVFTLNIVAHFFSVHAVVNRYDAYLIALGFFVITAQLGLNVLEKKRMSIRSTLRVLEEHPLLILVLVFSIQNGLWTLQIGQISGNIYQQQYQMGVFLSEYYANRTVALVDVGFANYLTDLRCVDLYGLADMDAANAKSGGYYTMGEVDRITSGKGVEIAVLFDNQFIRNNVSIIPAGWTKVGSWKIEDNVICGDDDITFYSVKDSSRKQLIDDLRAYSPRLPKEVIQEYGF
ncbi:MAG: hypothetical protein ABIH11_06330 [Candidatus Altiarchaeota archaeon]